VNRRRAFVSLAAMVLVVLSGAMVHADPIHDQNLDKWTPDKGRVSWRHYDNPHAHVIYHYFYWNTLADMELLRDDDNETLEMDVVFNNVAPESAWSYSYLGDTVGSHWDSNQPVAYRDTQLLDGNDYRPFTVGTAFADQLQPATWYYWWVQGDHHSDGSRAGVEAQHGYRSWNCFSGYANCVFADAIATLIWYQAGKPNEYTMPPNDCRYVYPRKGAPDPCLAW